MWPNSTSETDSSFFFHCLECPDRKCVCGGGGRGGPGESQRLFTGAGQPASDWKDSSGPQQRSLCQLPVCAPHPPVGSHSEQQDSLKQAVAVLGVRLSADVVSRVLSCQGHRVNSQSAGPRNSRQEVITDPLQQPPPVAPFLSVNAGVLECRQESAHVRVSSPISEGRMNDSCAWCFLFTA